ncbi:MULTISPECIES: GNAT family N-acetyltransferase [unclassified Marinomonas]|uniref:GNAT family N-acetyltransferase n=1 Tax=unclassified Marinomonas TaxID=196814 RepID=UPI0007AF8E5F|nr:MULTISPECIES: GNAT family N-acetyltransferase [unclassified Marinomonas]
MTQREKFEIREIEKNSLYLDEVESLFQSEWADFQLNNDYNQSSNLPAVIVATLDNELVGGLAFSRFKEPNREAEVIWINAVFVKPEQRGKGLAKALIRAGVNKACLFKQAYLYAYTNVPQLYQDIGWCEVDTESEPNHKVMSIKTYAD